MMSNKNTTRWQHALSNCITEPAELLELLQLDKGLLLAAERASQQFALRVPRGFVQRMKKGDVNDPLLLQVLPLIDENTIVPDLTTDAVGDLPARKLPGLLHKYHGRVLLTLSGACAINCRYCFRRAFPYQDNIVSSKQWQEILEYVRSDDTIEEVIFSGGDPLVASDKRLAAMIEDLASIAHMQRVRFHSRLPIVLPERVTDELIACLTATRLLPVMVVHCNHPNEVDSSVEYALQCLRYKNVPLYNQSVLLKTINDDANVLAELQKKLFQCGVQPYYLHLLDRVQGVLHFEVDEATALNVFQQLQAKLPGYLVPKLVREIPGEPSKTLMLK